MDVSQVTFYVLILAEANREKNYFLHHQLNDDVPVGGKKKEKFVLL